MKQLLICSLIATSIALAGCGGQSQDGPGQNPLTAPADYVGAAGRAQQSAIKTVDTAAVNSAIQQFQVAEGRNPETLQELVQKGYLSKIPAAPRGMKIEYDARTGRATVVPE
jgi:hypothetical protein